MVPKSDKKSTSTLKAKNQLNASLDIVREEGRGPCREAGKSGRGACAGEALLDVPTGPPVIGEAYRREVRASGSELKNRYLNWKTGALN